MIFSKQNVFIKGVIWAVVAAFVLSIFIFAGMFQYERAQRAEEQKKADEWDEKSKVSAADGVKPLARADGVGVTVKDFFTFYQKLDPEMRKYYATRERLVDLLDKYVDIRIKDKRLAEVKVGEAELAAELKTFLAKQNIPTKEELLRILEPQGVSFARFESEFLTPSVQQAKLMDELVNPRELNEKALRDYFEAHKERFQKTTAAPDGSVLSVPMEFAEARASVEAALKTDVTDDMLRAYYDKHRERFRGPAVATLSQILVREGQPKRRDTVKPADDELKAWYQLNRHLPQFRTREKYTVRNILVGKTSPRLLETIAIPEDEAKAYHEAHKADFTVPGQLEVGNLVVSAAKFAVEPSESALRDFYGKRGEVDCRHILVKPDQETLAVELRQQLLASPGDDTFTELCKLHSQDPGSKDKGGVYTKVRRGAMVKPFEDACFSLPVGGLSEPVKTDFGWHIVRVDAERGAWEKPYEEVSAEVRLKYVEEERDRRARERALEAKRRIEAGMPFEAAVKEYSDGALAAAPRTWKINMDPGRGNDYDPSMTGEIGMHGSVLYALRNAAKALEPGKLSEPVKSPLGHHVLKLAAKVEPRERPFEEARADVLAKMRAERAGPVAEARARDIHARLERGLKFADLAAQFSDDPNAKSGGLAGSFELEGSLAGVAGARGAVSADGITLLPEIAQELRRVRSAGKLLPPVVTSLGAHVLLVEEMTVSVPKPFEEVRALALADFTRERDAQATKLAAETAAQRLAGGAKFEEVAREFSDAPSAKAGGALGTFEVGAAAPADPARRQALRQEIMPNDWSLVPEFKEAVFALPVGKPSGVVKSPLGHHIFLVNAREKGALPPFEECRERIREVFLEKSLVTEQEIADYYDRNADDYRKPAKIRLKSILVPTESEAAALRKRIVDGGEAFDEVARRHSTDAATKDKGGDGGLVAEESIDPALREALGKVATGKVCEPVKVATGYAIAQLVERVPESRTPLAEVRGEIVERLFGPKKTSLFEDFVKELRNAAEIEWSPENFHLLEKYAGGRGPEPPRRR